MGLRQVCAHIDALPTTVAPHSRLRIFRGAPVKPLRISAMTAGLTATATVGAADDLIMTRSLHSAEDTINKLKRIVAERDLAVVARIGHAGGTEKIGKTLRPRSRHCRQPARRYPLAGACKTRSRARSQFKCAIGSTAPAIAATGLGTVRVSTRVPRKLRGRARRRRLCRAFTIVARGATSPLRRGTVPRRRRGAQAALPRASPAFAATGDGRPAAVQRCTRAAAGVAMKPR